MTTSKIDSRAEKFWHGWLTVASIIIILFGLIFSLYTIVNEDGIEILNRHIAKAFQLSPEFMIDVQVLQGWMVGVIGAITVGWGTTLLYLIRVPLKRKEKWAWKAIMISLTVWFTLDTIISSYYGAKFNIVFNIAFALQFIAPLLFIRNNMND